MTSLSKFVFPSIVFLALSCFVSIESTFAQENIDVSAMSDSKLRREISRARKQVYEVFNTLNEENEYDIVCTSKRQANSMIKEDICEPNFLKTMNSTASQDFMNNQATATGTPMQINPDGTITPGYSAGAQTGLVDRNAAVHFSQAEINRKNKVLAEKMVELANRYPELNNAVNNLRILNENYQQRMAAQ